jgi:hypothetical protein
MIKFFTNRELSKGLDINLAKWKRWSREFLLPDPLGGLQSGYARQYHPDEVFMVQLGGHLVSELKFTVPAAKQILKNLQWWLSHKGFYFNAKNHSELSNGIEALIKKYLILIYPERSLEKEFTFQYSVKGIISNKPVRYQGFEIMEELYAESSIGTPSASGNSEEISNVKTLNITDVLDNFVSRMGLDRSHYPALSKC